MFNSIEEYLTGLKKELAGCDRATIQDALSDAEEYLRMALEGALKETAHKSEAEALAPIIERYGQPAEIAAAYKAIEQHGPPAFSRLAPNTATPLPPAPPLRPAAPLPPAPPAPPRAVDNRNFLAKFFGVFADPKAWGSLLFILFVFGTGIIYFTWAMTGFWTSFGLIFAFLVGIPLMFLFLLSVRGIALIEGRLIEALTGVRMPRRPVFTRNDVGFWQKVKDIFFARQTWTALIYLVTQLVLGTVYFSVIVSLLGAGVWLIFRPIAELAWGIPAFYIDGPWFTMGWLMPFEVIGGILLIPATLHISRFIARCHAAYAKVMLVRE